MEQQGRRAFCCLLRSIRATQTMGGLLGWSITLLQLCFHAVLLEEVREQKKP